RAINHGKQRATTATEEHQSLQLSGPDDRAPYTFQAGHEGSIPFARSNQKPQVSRSHEGRSPHRLHAFYIASAHARVGVLKGQGSRDRWPGSAAASPQVSSGEQTVRN